ncbi:hypothetical protein [Pelagibacterium limicola]|uniref:hypothetical protein n=1 Tax=Pelagibacterium limicola TaxID=2791022 RepID=UPI0018AFC82D|nr:hypothetical protein [Pelagibacterium limicola]
MAFDPDVRLIQQALETSDEIGRIIRAHFSVEIQINEFIKRYSSAKVDERTSYSAKVNLLRAMNVPNGICLASSKIGKLRNELAHKHRTETDLVEKYSDDYLDSVAQIVPAFKVFHGDIGLLDGSGRYQLNFEQASQSERVVIASGFFAAIIGVLPKLYQFQKPLPIIRMAGVNL